jgi:hypothetical protein
VCWLDASPASRFCSGLRVNRLDFLKKIKTNKSLWEATYQVPGEWLGGVAVWLKVSDPMSDYPIIDSRH